MSTLKDKKAAQYLSTLLRACEKFISRIRFTSFKKKYPEIYESDPEVLKSNFEKFKTQLHSVIKDGLEELFTEKKLSNKLDELQILTEKAREDNNKKSWRPSGDPNIDIRDHRYQVKLNHKKDLEQILKHYKTQNEQLKKDICKTNTDLSVLEKEVFELEEQNNNKLEYLVKSQASIDNMEDLQTMVEENES